MDRQRDFTGPARGRVFKAFAVVALLGAGAATAQTDLVTAVRDGAGNLKLISWNAGGIRQNPPPQEATAGAIDLLAAVRLDKGSLELMVTAVRNARGDLLLIPWRVPFNGIITRIDQAPGAVNRAGQVSRIAAIGNRTGDRVVTAVRDGSGRLRVISWLVSASGSVNRLKEAAGGAVGDRLGLVPLEHVISATFIDSRHTRFATAVRDGGGNLRINTWRLAPDGTIIPRDEASAGAITEVSAVGLAENRLVTAVRDGGGNLKLIAWRVDSLGNITRGREFQAGAARQITAFPLAGDRLVTAVRDGGGNLKVIAWAVPTPAAIDRLDEASAGAVSRISGSRCGDFVPPGTLEFQTSVRDGSGRLALVKWRTSDNGETITRFRTGEARAGAVSLISTACYQVP